MLTATGKVRYTRNGGVEFNMKLRVRVGHLVLQYAICYWSWSLARMTNFTLKSLKSSRLRFESGRIGGS